MVAMLLLKLNGYHISCLIINMCMFVVVCYLVFPGVLALVLPTNGTTCRETFPVLCTF